MSDQPSAALDVLCGGLPDSPMGERLKGNPTGRDVEWEPLVDYRRNGVSETTIHGAVAASGDQLIHSFGGNVLCYGRSMMKPITMKIFAEDLADQLDWAQKAISVASHNADTAHATAQSILAEESGADADATRCPARSVWTAGAS